MPLQVLVSRNPLATQGFGGQSVVASISSGALTFGHEYLVLFSADLSTTLVAGGSGSQVEMWAAYGGIRQETYGSYQTATSGQAVRHSGMTKFIATSNSITLTLRAEGSTIVQAREIVLLAIDLDSDTSLLAQGDDGWLWDAGSPNTPIQTSWTSYGFLPFTADGSSTYLVIGVGQVDNATAPHTAQARLVDSVDGVIGRPASRTAQYLNSAYNLTCMATYVPSAGARNLDIQLQGSGTGWTVTNFRVFALRLDNFAYFGAGAGNLVVSPGSPVTLASVNTSLWGGNQNLVLGQIEHQAATQGFLHHYENSGLLTETADFYFPQQLGVENVSAFYADVDPQSAGPYEQKAATSSFSSTLRSEFLVLSTEFAGAVGAIEFSGEAAPSAVKHAEALGQISFPGQATGGIVVDYFGEMQGLIEFQGQASNYNPLILDRTLVRSFSEALADLKPLDAVGLAVGGDPATLNYLVVIDGTTLAINPAYTGVAYTFANPPSGSPPYQLGARKGDKIRLVSAGGGPGANDGKEFTIAVPSVLGNPTHIDVMEPVTTPDAGTVYLFSLIRRKA